MGWRLLFSLRQASFSAEAAVLTLSGLLLLAPLSGAKPSAASTASVKPCLLAEAKSNKPGEAAASGADAKKAEGSKKTEESKKLDESKKQDAGPKAALAAGKEVLEPSRFYGFASFGYAAAKSCPEVMEKLFCYCGCDLTDNHLSLLDCFTSVHGVDCHICQEEAVLANKLNKEGVAVAEIQRTIDEKYATQYPFETDTATYKKYKETRLYSNKDAGSEKIKFGSQAAGPEAPESGVKAGTEGAKVEPAAKPKLKPGKEIGSCCSNKAHAKGHGADSAKNSQKASDKDSSNASTKSSGKAGEKDKSK